MKFKLWLLYLCTVEGKLWLVLQEKIEYLKFLLTTLEDAT